MAKASSTSHEHASNTGQLDKSFYEAIFITNKVTKWPWEQAPIGADSVEYASNNMGQVGYMISLSYCYH